MADGSPLRGPLDQFKGTTPRPGSGGRRSTSHPVAGARKAGRRLDYTWSLALAPRSKEQGQVLEATGAAQGEALAVGDTEVDEYVELNRGLDPSLLGSDGPLARLAARVSKVAVIEGTIHCPDVAPSGRLIFAQAALPEDLATEYGLMVDAQDHPRFPRDGTADQWFDAAQFDAYRALGRYQGKQVRVASEQARPANSSAEHREALDAQSGSN